MPFGVREIAVWIQFDLQQYFNKNVTIDYGRDPQRVAGSRP